MEQQFIMILQGLLWAKEFGHCAFSYEVGKQPSSASISHSYEHYKNSDRWWRYSGCLQVYSL